MIFGLALILAAFVILGHDCQTWFERGMWSSTSISGVLELLQVDDYFIAHESPHFRRTRKGLNLGFLKRLDGESAGWGIDAGAEGAI